MIEEILGWLLAGVQVESAILSWKIAGKSWWETLLVMGGIGSLGILLPYGGISFIFWIFEKVFKRDLSFHIFNTFPQKSARYNTLRVHTRRAKVKVLVWVRNSLKKVRSHPYLVIFLINLIPIFPWLTLGTIIATKILNIRWGILAVLAGNFVKILIEVWVIFQI